MQALLLLLWSNLKIIANNFHSLGCFWSRSSFTCFEMTVLEDGEVVNSNKIEGWKKYTTKEYTFACIWGSYLSWMSSLFLQSRWLLSIGGASVIVLMIVDVIVPEVWDSTPAEGHRLSTLQRNWITREIQSMINGIVGKVHVKVWGAVQMSKVGGRRRERGEVKNIIIVY